MKSKTGRERATGGHHCTVATATAPQPQWIEERNSLSLHIRPSLPARARAAWGRADVRWRGEATRFKNISQLPTPMDASPNTEPGQETQDAPGIAGLAEVGQNDERYYNDLCSRQEDIPNAGVYLT